MTELKNAATAAEKYREDTIKHTDIYRAEMREAMAKLQKSVDYTNGRVTKLESRVDQGTWQQKGFIAAAVVIGGAFWRLVWLHFFGT